MRLYKKCTAKQYSFLVNHLHFRLNVLETIKKVIMTSDEKIADRKLQCNIN